MRTAVLSLVLFISVLARVSADDFDPTRLIGLDIPAAVAALGLPQQMFAWRGAEEREDNVVFYYPDFLYLFWYKDRVWQVRCDRRFASTVFGFSLGASREQVERTSLRNLTPNGDSLYFDLRRREIPPARAAGVHRERAFRPVRIQERLLKDRTAICLCLAAESIEEDLRIAEEYRGRYDLLELRVDRLSAAEAGQAGRLPARVGSPVILTLRRTREGGKFAGSEQERHALLARLADSGFAYIDLEEDFDAPDLEDASDRQGRPDHPVPARLHRSAFRSCAPRDEPCASPGGDPEGRPLAEKRR